MGRPARAAAGNVIYHVLNRANARRTMFEKPGDFAAFEQVIGEAQVRESMRILAYCLMPNHWHLVLWPSDDWALTRFVAWVTLTHTQRWHAHRRSAGTGHLYQGRFKAFPVQEDDHFLTVCRYVERNPLRAGLVAHAEDWRWSSLWRRTHGNGGRSWLAAWPMERSSSWLDWVNQPQTEAELEDLRESVQRSHPYGTRSWTQEMAEKLRVFNAPRPRARAPALQEP